MPSNSYRRWRTLRTKALDEIAGARAAVGGTARGRRRAAQQINHAYTVLLAAQFQGFCRDLHSECIEHLLLVLAPAASLKALLRLEMLRGRQLDRGNAQPSSLGADFGRLDVELWKDLASYDPASAKWKADLDSLNEWRNAIVHQDFTSPRLAGIITLPLSQVRRWRRTCGRLARTMDEMIRLHMQKLTGVLPW
jgi:hypothetical protein